MNVRARIAVDMRRAISLLALGVVLALTGCTTRDGSDSAVRDVSPSGLLADYARTLQAGPTHFIATMTGGPYGRLTYVGAEDLAHSAAEWVFDVGVPGVWLVVDGDDYGCTPHGGKAIVFAPGYCDASTPWTLYPPPVQSGLGDLIGGLHQALTGRLVLTASMSSASDVRRLGKASIRGVNTTGYAFNLDTAAADAVLASAAVPQHDVIVAVHVWIDAVGLVREFRLDMQTTVPGIPSAPPPATDGPDAEIIPNPSLVAERAVMNAAVPTADRTPEVPTINGPGQLTWSTTTQLWDIRTAPPIEAPPPDAVRSPGPP
jgi:hypothetical protein